MWRQFTQLSLANITLPLSICGLGIMADFFQVEADFATGKLVKPCVVLSRSLSKNGAEFQAISVRVFREKVWKKSRHIGRWHYCLSAVVFSLFYSPRNNVEPVWNVHYNQGTCCPHICWHGEIGSNVSDCIGEKWKDEIQLSRVWLRPESNY